MNTDEVFPDLLVCILILQSTTKHPDGICSAYTLIQLLYDIYQWFLFCHYELYAVCIAINKHMFSNLLITDQIRKNILPMKYLKLKRIYSNVKKENSVLSLSTSSVVCVRDASHG